MPLKLNWLPFPLDPLLWMPSDFADNQKGWFLTLLEASLRSEWPGYLVVPGSPETKTGQGSVAECGGSNPKAGRSGTSEIFKPETLWRLAGAPHPGTWKRHGPKVWAHFQCAQMHGRQVLYFPPLVEMIEAQKKRMRVKKGRFPKDQQESTGGAGLSLSFDFDVAVDSKEIKECQKKPPGRSYAQADFDERDWRKLQAELQAIYLPLQGARIVDVDPPPPGAYSRPALFREACRRAGVTVERGRSLAEMQARDRAAVEGA